MMSSSRLARPRSCVKPRAIRFLQILEHVSTFLLKKVLVVAAGITLFEALKAADALAAAGVKVLNGLLIKLDKKNKILNIAELKFLANLVTSFPQGASHGSVHN